MELYGDFDREFTISEIAEMGILYKQKGNGSISQQLCEELATKFSSSAHGREKPRIKWEQVYDWFMEIKLETESTIIASEQKADEDVPPPSTLLTDKTDKSNRGRKAKNVIPFAIMGDNNSPPLSRVDTIAELPELLFEAKSSRDNAWFDVAAFLNHRITSLGELEARVRFSGFDNDHDEWVNVKRGVRERSIPLHSSECHRVNIGDLVLCYRDAEQFCLYYDAHIVDIQRNKHEDNACNCIFVVQYDFDKFAEKVPASRICYRPASKSPSTLSKLDK